MACVGITLANRAAAPKRKNLRRLWSKTSSVMPHLQILGRGRGIDADHSSLRRRPQDIYGHQFGVSVPAQDFASGSDESSHPWSNRVLGDTAGTEFLKHGTSPRHCCQD